MKQLMRGPHREGARVVFRMRVCGYTGALTLNPLAIIGMISVSWCAGAADRFVGARACAACHPGEFKSQSASAHAGALSRVADRSNFPAGTLSRDGRYRYSILPASEGLRVQIEDGVERMDLPLQWAFGAGRQAVTFVTRVNRDWYVEHYATWYTATNSYGPTPGHEALHPKSLREAAGLLYKITDPQAGIQGCFECHSTGPVSFDAKGDPTVNETGVHCEGCHGPGSAHAANPERNRLTNPADLAAAGLNNFCGRCHRRPSDQGPETDWNYAWNVRHQPVYLKQSLCFRKSGGRLSCLNCHDPHESARKKPVSAFDAKCAECHAECGAKERANCVDCHMPLVSPQPPLRFTNHWIGVYRAGGKLKPVR
jgi:hypothetical protein